MYTPLSLQGSAVCISSVCLTIQGDLYATHFSRPRTHSSRAVLARRATTNGPHAPGLPYGEGCLPVQRSHALKGYITHSVV
jgi:hypothetical protein